jgi:hypothetical protein
VRSASARSVVVWLPVLGPVFVRGCVFVGVCLWCPFLYWGICPPFLLLNIMFCPLFLLLNIMIRSSSTCSRKNYWVKEDVVP